MSAEAEPSLQRRDRRFWRCLLLGTVLLFIPYFLMDWAGMLPSHLSVRERTRHRRSSTMQDERAYEDYDPNLILGIAIGDTRYRFNYAEHFALIMRPLFGVEVWRIPETVEYRGETYTVTSLDTFALLHATTVREVYLPATLRYFNNAPTLASASIQSLTVADYTAAPKDFNIPHARRALGLDPDEEDVLPSEGDAQ